MKDTLTTLGFFPSALHNVEVSPLQSIKVARVLEKWYITE